MNITKSQNVQDEKQTMNSGLSWTIYITLVAARIFGGPFLYGYVHPDEFFQGGQELFYGYPPRVPWEFQAENALRSVVPPGLLSYLPLSLYQHIMGRTDLSGQEILILPRVFCGILSVLAVDWSVWSLSGETNTGAVPTSVLLLASAWPTFVMLNRPFSNSLETFFLALLLCNVLKGKGRTTFQNILIGAFCALGLFTRFTFVFFAFPIMLFFLYDTYTKNNIHGALGKIMVTATTFFIMGEGIIFLDTAFYSYYHKHMIDYSNLVVTPWNALAYNSKVSNLKDHGLHPRWTHAVVNMFLLFGPLTAITYFVLLSSRNKQTTTATTLVYRLVIVSGLGLLSLAPHQEPRFLLPLIVPLSLLGNHALGKSKTFCAVWIIFNLILFVLFGVLHQSGVVKSLLTLGSLAGNNTDKPLALIYYHTYMAPTFLLRSIEKEEVCQAADREEQTCRQGSYHGILHDLNGSGLKTLQATLDEKLSCSQHPNNENYVYLSMPPMAQDDEDTNTLWSLTTQSCDLPGYECQLIFGHKNHLSTEDLPPFDGSIQSFYKNGLVLNTFKISCATSKGG